jgi:peptidoglycan hydrolase-like protein with peptidoglycan-binding domain
MAFSLTWLPEVLRGAGLKVAEVQSWADRGRGPMAATVKGVVCHHTVGNPKGNMPSLDLLTKGRKKKDGTMLQGPLAQLGLGRDGTYYVIAAGRANHAGEGSWRGVSGNSSVIGIEAENTGYNTGANADPWPDVQLDAYKRGCAAILTKLGASSDMCCGHKEWRPTGPNAKIDPHTIDMSVFRADVKLLMSGKTPPGPLIAAIDDKNRPTLTRGSKAENVKTLQGKLGLPKDGMFGPGTEAALREFQRANGLVPDGIAGPATWKALIG